MAKQKIQLDGHKLMYHPEQIAKWIKGEVFAPIYVEIGPIRSCNHKCSFCSFDYLKRTGESIDKDVLIKNLKDMSEFGVKSIMFGGDGESLLYPYLPEVIEKAKNFGLDIAITSNGVLLNEEKSKLILKNLSWIKISIDAGTKKSYAKIHGTKEQDFPLVLKNLKFACEYKIKNNLSCKIGCQMVVTDESIDGVENLILELKDIGLDYFVLKPYVKHPLSINEKKLSIKDYDSILSKLIKKYSNEKLNIIYRKISFLETEKESLDYDECYGLNFMALIDASGDVIPCGLFHDKEEFTYGNINDKPFSEIWDSKKRLDITNKVYKRGCEKCRNHCRLNFINQYLDVLKNNKKNHVNFI